MHKPDTTKAPFYSKWIKLIDQKKELLQETNMLSIRLLLPAILSLMAAFFEGLSVGLLIPIAKGIIEMDFAFVREMPFFKGFIIRFPQLFVTPNSSIFIFLLTVIFSAAVIKNALSYFSLLTIDHQRRRFNSKIRKIIMRRYLSFGKLFFDGNSEGRLINTLVSFTDLTAKRVEIIHMIVKWSLVAAVYLTIMCIISWKLTIFVLIAPPILHYSLKWLVKKIKKTSGDFAEYKSKLSFVAYNILSCMPLIKLATTEQKEGEKFDCASDQVEAFEFSMDKKERLIDPVQEIILLMIILLVVAAMAFLIIKDRSGGIAGFLVYFYLLRRGAGACNNLTREMAKMARTRGPLSEILAIFDDKEKYFVFDGNKEFEGLKEGIKYNRLHFSYVPGVQVLNDVTFSVEKGKITAIVGPTGSGKTTLAHLLLRFYDCPTSSIMIDGVDIREFTIKSLRAHISLVSQETLLFNDTLRANITYGVGKVDDEALVDAVKKARLYELIKKLPDDFDTLIGDRGVKLSGGERQRVAIARALLKGSEILVLDEATSSLDSITERLIQEAIEEAIKDRTAIVIAHRLSTIKNSDKVVVIENGKLIEQGSLSGLLEKKGKFYEYWNEQRFF